MITETKPLLDTIIPMLPIIGAGVVGDNQKLSTPNMISRVLELAILGGIFLYTTVQVLESRLAIIEIDMQKRSQQYEVFTENIHQLKTDVAVLQLQVNNGIGVKSIIGNVSNSK